MQRKRLTFSTVVFDRKSFSNGFTDPNIQAATWGNSSTEPELPAPYPARIIGEFDVSNICKAIPQGGHHFSG